MRATVLLIALAAAGFAATIFYELRPRSPGPADLAARPAAAPPRAADPLDQPGTRAGLAEALLARPLFSHSRRPPDAAKPSGAAASAAPLPRMTAILIDGPRRRAIFAAPEGGKPTIVAEGGRIGAFTVQAIEPQQVTVLGPEGKRLLRTAFDTAAPPPSRPASFAAPAAPLFPGIALPGARPSGGPAPAPYPPPTVPAPGAGYGQPSGAAR